jgi:hypothetical protein
MMFSIFVGLLMFVPVGIGFDTERTEPFFRIGSQVTD